MSRRNKPSDIWKCFDLNPKPPCTCWLWTRGVSDKGIPYFNIGGKKIIAYRFTYWLTHPTWDINNPREVIRHGCTDTMGNAVDNPLCGRPDHLTPGTHEDNMIDMMVRGRKGLRTEVVRDILDLLKRVEEKTLEITHADIAQLIGAKHGIDIARTTVTDINTGRRRYVLKNHLDAQDRVIKESGNAV